MALCAVALSIAGCEKDTQLEKDCDAVEGYLSKYGITADCIKHVYYISLKEGTGEQFYLSDTVMLKYCIKLLSDTTVIVDQSLNSTTGIDRACWFTTDSTYSNGTLISGLQVGLTTMKVGGKSRFFVPSSYAYGSDAISSKSETYANLMCDIELCEIIHKK